MNYMKRFMENGLIGNDLYQIVTEDFEDNTLSVIAGAALQASFEAYENAKKTNLPLVMKEGDFLYEVNSDGEKKLLKSFPKSLTTVSQNFISK